MSSRVRTKPVRQQKVHKHRVSTQYTKKNQHKLFDSESYTPRTEHILSNFGLNKKHDDDVSHDSHSRHGIKKVTPKRSRGSRLNRHTNQGVGDNLRPGQRPYSGLVDMVIGEAQWYKRTMDMEMEQHAREDAMREMIGAENDEEVDEYMRYTKNRRDENMIHHKANQSIWDNIDLATEIGLHQREAEKEFMMADVEANRREADRQDKLREKWAKGKHDKRVREQETLTAKLRRGIEKENKKNKLLKQMTLPAIVQRSQDSWKDYMYEQLQLAQTTRALTSIDFDARWRTSDHRLRYRARKAMELYQKTGSIKLLRRQIHSDFRMTPRYMRQYRDLMKPIEQEAEWNKKRTKLGLTTRRPAHITDMMGAKMLDTPIVKQYTAFKKLLESKEHKEHMKTLTRNLNIKTTEIADMVWSDTTMVRTAAQSLTETLPHVIGPSLLHSDVWHVSPTGNHFTLVSRPTQTEQSLRNLPAVTLPNQHINDRVTRVQDAIALPIRTALGIARTIKTRSLSSLGVIPQTFSSLTNIRSLQQLDPMTIAYTTQKPQLVNIHLASQSDGLGSNVITKRITPNPEHTEQLDISNDIIRQLTKTQPNDDASSSSSSALQIKDVHHTPYTALHNTHIESVLKNTPIGQNTTTMRALYIPIIHNKQVKAITRLFFPPSPSEGNSADTLLNTSHHPLVNVVHAITSSQARPALPYSSQVGPLPTSHFSSFLQSRNYNGVLLSNHSLLATSLSHAMNAEVFNGTRNDALPHQSMIKMSHATPQAKDSLNARLHFPSFSTRHAFNINSNMINQRINSQHSPLQAHQSRVNIAQHAVFRSLVTRRTLSPSQAYFAVDAYFGDKHSDTYLRTFSGQDIADHLSAYILQHSKQMLPRPVDITTNQNSQQQAAAAIAYKPRQVQHIYMEKIYSGTNSLAGDQSVSDTSSQQTRTFQNIPIIGRLFASFLPKQRTQRFSTRHIIVSEVTDNAQPFVDPVSYHTKAISLRNNQSNKHPSVLPTNASRQLAEESQYRAFKRQPTRLNRAQLAVESKAMESLLTLDPTHSGISIDISVTQHQHQDRSDILPNQGLGPLHDAKQAAQRHIKRRSMLTMISEPFLTSNDNDTRSSSSSSLRNDLYSYSTKHQHQTMATNIRHKIQDLVSQSLQYNQRANVVSELLHDHSTGSSTLGLAIHSYTPLSTLKKTLSATTQLLYNNSILNSTCFNRSIHTLRNNVVLFTFSFSTSSPSPSLLNAPVVSLSSLGNNMIPVSQTFRKSIAHLQNSLTMVHVLPHSPLTTQLLRNTITPREYALGTSTLHFFHSITNLSPPLVSSSRDNHQKRATAQRARALESSHSALARYPRILSRITSLFKQQTSQRFNNTKQRHNISNNMIDNNSTDVSGSIDNITNDIMSLPHTNTTIKASLLVSLAVAQHTVASNIIPHKNQPTTLKPLSHLNAVSLRVEPKLFDKLKQYASALSDPSSSLPTNISVPNLPYNMDFVHNETFSGHKLHFLTKTVQPSTVAQDKFGGIVKVLGQYKSNNALLRLQKSLYNPFNASSVDELQDSMQQHQDNMHTDIISHGRALYAPTRSSISLNDGYTFKHGDKLNKITQVLHILAPSTQQTSTKQTATSSSSSKNNASTTLPKQIQNVSASRLQQTWRSTRPSLHGNNAPPALGSTRPLASGPIALTQTPGITRLVTALHKAKTRFQYKEAVSQAHNVLAHTTMHSNLSSLDQIAQDTDVSTSNLSSKRQDRANMNTIMSWASSHAHRSKLPFAPLMSQYSNSNTTSDGVQMPDTMSSSDQDISLNLRSISPTYLSTTARIYANVFSTPSRARKAVLGGTESDATSHELVRGTGMLTTLISPVTPGIHTGPLSRTLSGPSLAVIHDPNGINRSEISRLCTSKLDISHLNTGALGSTASLRFVPATHTNTAAILTSLTSSQRSHDSLVVTSLDHIQPSPSSQHLLNSTNTSALIPNAHRSRNNRPLRLIIDATTPGLSPSALSLVSPDGRGILEDSGMQIHRVPLHQSNDTVSPIASSLPSQQALQLMAHVSSNATHTHSPALLNSLQKEINARSQLDSRAHTDLLHRESARTQLPHSVVADRIKHKISTISSYLSQSGLFDNKHLRDAVFDTFIPKSLAKTNLQDNMSSNQGQRPQLRALGPLRHLFTSSTIQQSTDTTSQNDIADNTTITSTTQTSRSALASLPHSFLRTTFSNFLSTRIVMKYGIDAHPTSVYHMLQPYAMKAVKKEQESKQRRITRSSQRKLDEMTIDLNSPIPSTRKRKLSSPHKAIKRAINYARVNSNVIRRNEAYKRGHGVPLPAIYYNSSIKHQGHNSDSSDVTNDSDLEQ